MLVTWSGMSATQVNMTRTGLARARLRLRTVGSSSALVWLLLLLRVSSKLLVDRVLFLDAMARGDLATGGLSPNGFRLALERGGNRVGGGEGLGSVKTPSSSVLIRLALVRTFG